MASLRYKMIHELELQRKSLHTIEAAERERAYYMQEETPAPVAGLT